MMDILPSRLERPGGEVGRTESVMRIMHHTQDEAVPDPSPIFVGDVLRQNLIADDDATLLRVTSVTFVNGARNRWHRHSADQVLIVTGGRGIVANEDKEWRLSPGDVVLVPAGERHWHGAEAGSEFTHLSILTPGEMTIDDAG
jgi:4-carboxymuconolactone decarboxylase